MRKKEKRLVISFEATTMAILMEKVCKENQMQGRLIPLPPVLSAGCGLAWLAGSENQVVWKRFMDEHGIVFDKLQNVEI